MKKILAVDINKIVKESNAQFFQFFLQTEDGKIFTWRKTGFSEVNDGHYDTRLFTKDEAIEEYHRALNDARQDTTPSLFSGNARLDVHVVKLK